MEENEKLEGFNTQSYGTDYSNGYPYEGAGFQGTDNPYPADLPAEQPVDEGKKGKKAKKEKPKKEKGKKHKGAEAENGEVAVANADGSGHSSENAEDEEKEKKEKPVDPELKKLYDRKTAVSTSYFVALLCLIAGLVAPLFKFAKGGNLLDMMMFKYIPSMFNHMIGKDLIPVVGIFKEMPGLDAGVFNFTCLIGVIYTVITAVAIAMFVPILLCGLGKKNKKTGATAALVVEMLAILVTAAYVVYSNYEIILSSTASSWSDYNFFIPLGGSLLMVIIQVIAAKRALGVSKTIAVILSGIGIFALLDVAMINPAWGTTVDNIAAKFGIDAGFISGLSLTTTTQGIGGFKIFLNLITDKGATAGELLAFASDPNNFITFVIYILFMLAVLFTLLNLVVDVIGLATGRLTKKVYRITEVPARDEEGRIKKGRDGKDKMKKVKTNDKAEVTWNNPVSNTFAVVRFLLTLLFLGGLIAIRYLVKVDDGEPIIRLGVYFWLLTIMVFFSLLNACIRTGVANFKKKKQLKKLFEEDKESRKNYDFAGAEQYGNNPASPYGGQYGDPYGQYNGYYGQQPAYDPYAQQQYQQPVQQQPAYDPYAQQQQPAQQSFETYQQPVQEQPVAEQTYVNEQPVQEEQQPAYEEYAQQQQPAYDPYAQQQQPAYDPYAQQQYQQPVQQQPTYEPYAQPQQQPAYDPYAQQQYQQPVQQQPAYEPYAQPQQQPAYDPYAQQQYQQPVQPQPAYNPYAGNGYAPYQAPVSNPFEVGLSDQPEEPVTSGATYDGPTDAFIDTLSDSEKTEFIDVFVNKTKGSVKGVPDYAIGEDNSEFFSTVFVHINRYRNSVSDSLMTKLYKQLIG